MVDYRDQNHIDPNGNFSITQLAKFIREKMFGIDVREAIAKALEKIYEDASKDGNANMEVSQARGLFGLLKDRLDNSDSSLSQKADRVWTEMTFATIQTQFTSTFLNIQSLRSAYPGGAPGTFLVLDTDGLYVWNGNEWVFDRTYDPSYVEFKDSSITQKKLADAKIDFSNQLVNARFDDTSSWGFDGEFSSTVNGNRLIITPAGSADLVNAHQLIALSNNRKYYAQVEFTINNTNVDTVYIIAGSKVIASIKPTSQDVTYKIFGIINNTVANFLQFRFLLKNHEQNQNTRLVLTKPLLVDVTYIDTLFRVTAPICKYILDNYFDGWISKNNNLSKIALNEALMLSDNDGAMKKINQLPVFDYNVFNKSYIKNKKMVTNLNQGSNDVKAFYNFIDVNKPILKMSAKVSWTGKNTAALISQNNGMHNVSDITTSSIHILYQPDHVYIQMFVPGTGLVDLKAVDFPMLNLTGDVVYNIGWELVDDTITVTMPHGATTSHTDARFKDVTGRYGCFEHFANVTNSGYGDTCYHEISINDTFYDDFARFDGSLGISPSGHIYSQISRV